MTRVIAIGAADGGAQAPSIMQASAGAHAALYQQVAPKWQCDFVACATEEEVRSALACSDWTAALVDDRFARTALDACDISAASAKLAEGASLLVRRKGSIVGIDSLGSACVSALEQAGCSLGGARVAVCGSGPAALVTVQAAAVGGAQSIVLVGRVKQQAQRSLTRMIGRYKQLAYATVDLQPDHPGHRSFREAYADPDFLFGSYRTSTQALRDADVIIRAADDAASPLPFSADVLGGQTAVADAVDLTGAGALLQAALGAGCTVVDGWDIVAHQAVADASVVLQLAGVDNLPSSDDMFACAHGARRPC